MENKEQKQSSAPVPAVFKIKGFDFKNLFNADNELIKFETIQLKLLDDVQKLNIIEEHYGIRDFETVYFINREESGFKNNLQLHKLKWTSQAIYVFDPSHETKILNGLPDFPKELANYVGNCVDESQSVDPVEKRKWDFLKEIVENYKDLLDVFGVEITKTENNEEYTINLFDLKLKLTFVCMTVSDTFEGFIPTGSVFDDAQDFEEHKGEKYNKAYDVIEMVFKKVCQCHLVVESEEEKEARYRENIGKLSNMWDYDNDNDVNDDNDGNDDNDDNDNNDGNDNNDETTEN